MGNPSPGERTDRQTGRAGAVGIQKETSPHEHSQGLFDDPRNTYIVANDDPAAFDKRFVNRPGVERATMLSRSRASLAELLTPRRRGFSRFGRRAAG